MGQGKPWRELREPDFNKAYTKGKHRIDNIPKGTPVKFALMGHTGGGKSCFINTVKSIMTGQICDVTKTKGSDVPGLGTSKFTRHKVTKYLHFYDVAGSGETGMGSAFEYLEAIFEGKVKLESHYNGADSLQEPSDKHKPVCIIFVMSVHALLGEDEMKTMQTIHERLPQDLPKILVITKIDEICDSSTKDIRNIYISRKVYEMVTRASNGIGIDENKIFPVINFTKEDKIDELKAAPHLFAVWRAIDFAMENKEDSEDEE